MKQPMHNRILSFLLAFLLLWSNVPFSVLSIGSSGDSAQSGSTAVPQLQYDYDTMYIARDGKQIQSLPLLSHEKIELSADGVAETAQYQWQVEHPEKEGVWVNVYDGTEKTISVTLALVENVLRENGTAKLRCRAYTDTYAYLSNTVTVMMAQEQTVSSKLAMAPGGAVTLADDEPATPEFVTVTVRYEQWDRDGEGHKLTKTDVFTAYVATLVYGAAPPMPVECPKLVGYAAQMGSITVGGVENLNAATFENNFITVSLDSVTADIVVTIRFMPIEVQYRVRYFFQNVYDDLYTEDTSMALDDMGFTGTTPDLAINSVPGYTCLYFEPDSIAADGSTVFYVYYERNYYLMEFDCDGGYGTDTLYVRYGTSVVVSAPIKKGYVFGGWDFKYAKDENGDEVELNDGSVANDGSEDSLPATLPPYNTAYKALWEMADTSYSVAYWILDSNGNKTYIGSRTVSAKSGDTASGEHDLDGTFHICGSEAHTHSDDCYICGFTSEHTHASSCFTNLSENEPGDNGRKAIKDLGNGGDPESGYIYVIYNPVSGTYWPKLFLDGKYYVVNNTQGEPTEDSYSSIIEGEVLSQKKGTYGTETLTTKKYRPATICGTFQHTHDNSCRTCKEHTHSQGCYQDDKQLIEVHEYTYKDENGNDVTVKTDQNVTVLGDGSTVVNVYYQYKEYTLKFYYAATTGGSADDNDGNADTYDSVKVVGGTTYYFGRSGSNSAIDEVLLENEYWNYSGQWGSISKLPTLNTEGEKKNYTKGSVTYSHNNTDVTYHYISFKARYNDNISDMWPCGVFNSATRTDKNNANGWSGTEAFVSAWNGEHHVKYSEKSNQTIKGVYEKLDDWLLFDSQYLLNLTEEEKNDPQKNGTEVSYLCFWENGANISWSVPELYRYNIWLEGNAPNGERTVIRDGKTFYLADSYDTCDNSSVAEQTQVGLTGYTEYFVKQELGDPYKYSKYEYTTLSQQDGDFDGNLYKEGYVVNFYYTANTHSLKFWNHNGWLGDGKGAGMTEGDKGVPYGTSLKKFGDYVNAKDFMDAHYPDGLEPGAYEFAGWYTTSLCVEGTEVYWQTATMPDADMTVYAKWSPVERDVYFYLTYNDMANYQALTDEEKETAGQTYFWQTTKQDGTTVTYPISVTHGENIGAAYGGSIPERYIDMNGNGQYDEGVDEKYIFVGWFYMDENGKKRFAPDSMEVKQDLHLFAEWRTEIDTQYTIHYLLDEDVTIDGHTYPKGTPIAESTVGHMSAGHTKTFEGKGGAQLLPEFQNKNLFPKISSHSILMDVDPNNNKFTFLYEYDEEVQYRVQYLDKVTRLPVHEEKNGITEHAVITEKYEPIVGYVPESYYITKVLSADGAGNQLNEANIITFYYVQTETTALYSVKYYQEKLGSNDPSDVDNYDLLHTEVFTGEIGHEITKSVDKSKYTGFTYQFSTVTTYTENGSGTFDVTTSAPDKSDQFQGKLSAGGLEFSIYYSRNVVSYTIKYMEWGTDHQLDSGYFEEPKYQVGTMLTFSAPDTVNRGINYYFFDAPDHPQTQSLTIQADAQHNELVFYYKPKEVNIYYYAVCLTPGAKEQEFGHVSVNVENATSSSTEGSTAMPASGFRFVGWYTRPTCTEADKVSDDQMDGSYHLIPERPNEDVSYYALFEPITTDLTIEKDVDEHEATDNFLFRIQGLGKHAYIDLIVSITGDASVVINNLPVGEYRITELTAWSWEYGDKPTWTFVVNGTQEQSSGDIDSADYAENAQIKIDEKGGAITFTNTFTDSDWLENETSKENIFAGVTAP